MSDDNPYDLLADEVDDGGRWAFGTGFVDALAGIDPTVPAGVDPEALAARCLALGDDALVYSHRLQQWITRMPELEEETALANIALDLLGQARMLLSRAGGILGRTEDELAFFRDVDGWRNVRLVERADDDFAHLVARLLVFTSWRLASFAELRTDADPVLAAIAGKGVIELAYHRDYAAQWVVRLGDGTEVSHARMQAALDAVWPMLEELFADGPAERGPVDAVLDTVLATAGLHRPPGTAAPGAGGRHGEHTGALGQVLAELQSVARRYPDATW